MTTDAACQAMLAARDRLAALRVLTAGGANVEHGYSLPVDFQVDSKVTVEPQPRIAGGSSVNHACRLLAMGVDVHPVIPLAQADPLSAVIVEAFEAAARTGEASFRRTDLALRGAGLSTPFTTILRQNGARAVLNEFSADLMDAYHRHVLRHLERSAPRGRGPDVVVVGHVHADRVPPAPGAVGFSGEITERLLVAPEVRSARKVVNFGPAQYRQGTKRWGRILRDHVDVFQLDIGEVRQFCADAGLERDSLEAIFAWFRERCTVVVSLERFGAIGQLAGSDRPVAAWPFVLDDVVDSTGAGDAMGAGLVAALGVSSFLDESAPDAVRRERFEQALAFGRACGAHACTTIGGAVGCPSLDQLAEFEASGRLHARDEDPGRTVTPHELFLIDRAFDR